MPDVTYATIEREEPSVEEMDEASLAQIEQDRVEEEEKMKQELIAALEVFGNSLSHNITSIIAERKPIEDRWIDDLRQYNGLYDEATESALASSGGSKVFVNVTRSRTDNAVARLSDMLFPTDGNNFAITHTPVPDIGMDKAVKEKLSAIQVAGVSPEQLANLRDEIRDGAARVKAKRMERVISDQLVESAYNALGREVIHDACIFGTGVIKGPTIVSDIKRRWENTNDSHILIEESDYRPAVERIDLFDFFPDLSVPRIGDTEYTYERQFITAKRLRSLAKQQEAGYLPEQISKVLNEEPRQTTNAHLTSLRSISGISNVKDKRYEMWVYHGPVDKDVLLACGCDFDEEDNLTAYEGVAYFINSTVIKAHINVMDSKERPYSVYNYEQDIATIFGYGIPYRMRTPQRIINASWRMMMDNAGLATGPQIVFNDGVVEPVPINGQTSWSLTPRKAWRLTDKNRNVREAFAAIDIPSYIGELSGIHKMAQELVDAESGVPQISNTQAGAYPHQTAHGMSMLMNDANINLRTPVKGYDDNVTTPLITRMYDWNMQFNRDETIKGDYKIKATGSTSLLTKETQAKNIMAVLQVANHPAFAPITKWPELYKKFIGLMQLDPSEIVKGDAEIAATPPALPQAEQTPPDTSAADNQVKMKIHQDKMADRQEDRQFKGQLKQAELGVENRRIDMEQQGIDKSTNAQLVKKQMDIESNRQKLIDEAKLENITGSNL